MDWGEVAMYAGGGGLAGLVIGVSLPVLLASPDSAIDLASLAIDVYTGDAASFALDAMSLMIPGVTGAGSLSHLDEGYDAYRAVNEFGNVYDASHDAYRSAEDIYGLYRKEPFAGRSIKASELMNEVGKIANIDIKRYVDGIYFSPHIDAPFFSVTELKERIIVLDVNSLKEESRSLQLIIGSHEFAHAQQFDAILLRKFDNDIYAAREYWISYYNKETFEGLSNYARREIVAERLAYNRVVGYMGGLPPDVIGKSMKYRNKWREIYNSLKPLLP